MRLSLNWKQAGLTAVALLALGAGIATAANKYSKPKSIVHVVKLTYKDGTTDEQKKAVLDGVEKMASEIPGLKNIWLKSIRMQGEYTEKLPDGTVKVRPFTDSFVMEFENEASFKAYADHPSHTAWEKIYTPVRGRSATSDITN